MRRRIELDKDKEVARNIQEAWNRIESWVMAEEGEMERRLARREAKCFRRPLRAFCVAIRANDHRIDEMGAEIVPRHAVHLDAEAHPGRYAEHTVRITDELVERACAPYHIGPPGEPADEVAKKLGCLTNDLFTIRRSGELRVTPKPGLREKLGGAHPVDRERRMAG